MKSKKYKIIITWKIPYELNGITHYNTTEIILEEYMIFGLLQLIINPEIMRIEVLENDK